MVTSAVSVGRGDGPGVAPDPRTGYAYETPPSYRAFMHSDFALTGRTALITGSVRGLGREMARGGY